MKPQYLFKKFGKKYGIDPNILIAIAKVESSLSLNTARFEPHWRYHYRTEEFAKKLGITNDTDLHMWYRYLEFQRDLKITDIS